MIILQTERNLPCLPQILRNRIVYIAADMIDVLCTATEVDNSTPRTYFKRVVRGIFVDFLEETTNARVRIYSALCGILARIAVCVVDTKLRRGMKASELFVVPGNKLG